MIISLTKTLFEERVVKFMIALRRCEYSSDTLHIWNKQVKYKDHQMSLSKQKDLSMKDLSLMLLSFYNEVWEYTDLREVLITIRNKWAQIDISLSTTLFKPLIKLLRQTENLFNKFLF